MRDELVKEARMFAVVHKAKHRMISNALADMADQIEADGRRIAELEAFQQQAIKHVCELAREAGEAKGKLKVSEMPGIVDGWQEKCERLEAALRPFVEGSSHTMVFLETRNRMHPVGQDQYRKDVERARAALEGGHAPG